jgi:hypothetical protein
LAYLSDPEDDDDIIVSNTVTLEDFLEVDEEPQKEYYSIQDTDPVSAENMVHETRNQESEEENLDWWDGPVEGERKNIDERVDEAGNQPISQPAEPEPKEVEWTDDDLPATEAELREASAPLENEITEKDCGVWLPLAQPKEQGEYRGMAASGEYTGTAGDGEGVDEVDWGIVTVDEHPKGVEPAQGYYSNAVWEFPEPPDEKTRRRKVNLGMEGRSEVKPAPMERR